MANTHTHTHTHTQTHSCTYTHKLSYLTIADLAAVIGVTSNEEHGNGTTPLGAICQRSLGSRSHNFLDSVKNMLECWKEQGLDISRGPICSFESDGASVMVLLLWDFFSEFVIDLGGPIGCKLFGVGANKGVVGLFHLVCGGSADFPIVAGCDPKHVMKRVRMFLKSVSGCHLLAEMMSRQDLRKHLLVLYSNASVKEWFGVGSADAMDVKAAVGFLLAMAKMARHEMNDPVWEKEGYKNSFGTAWPQRHRAFQLSGKYCEAMFNVGLGVKISMANGCDFHQPMTVAEIVEAATCLSHLAFFIWRESSPSRR